jgi:X-Pro dipeptidyl-peptidase
MTTGLAAAVCALATAAPALADTEPIYSYTDALRERVWIDSGFDSDKDGFTDRIAVDIMRPQETATAGLKVPVIIDASPYYTTLGRGNESERKQDVDGDGLNDKWPLFYDNYFVPRGYAMALLDMVGTGFSSGCPVTGGREDNLSGKVLIDWLNGRATAYDKDGNIVTADWDNGKAAMIGKSYDGTLANAVAASGVPGLTTIVPISAISSWYDYTRSNGVVTRGGNYPSSLSNTVTNADRRAHCQPIRDMLAATDGDEDGDYDKFWRDRNYVPAASNVRASVFVVHGLNDNNVKPDHFSKLWYKLAANGVPRKIWLTQTGHVDPFDFRRAQWVTTLHRWFDYWLQGIDNGIMSEPMADVERAADVWETYASWPDPAASDAKLWLRAGDLPGAGVFSLTQPQLGQTQFFLDDSAQQEATMVATPEVPTPSRLVFVSPALRKAVRMSGTAAVVVKAAANQTDTNLGAILVDYGTATRVNHRATGEGITTLTTEDCWGESSPTDDPCYRQTQKNVAAADSEVVTKGILDAVNRTSISDATPLIAGQAYTFRFTFLPEDYVFEAGHRIGLVLVGSYPGYSSQADTTRAQITVSLNDSMLVLPTVGGLKAVKAGF